MKSSFLETIKAFNGEVYNLEYHQKRYESVLSAYSQTNYKELSKYIQAPTEGLYRCRLLYTLEDITISYHKYEKREISSFKIIYCDDIEYWKKSSNRDELNKLYDKKDDCDDILIVKNGLITDTSIANIAFFDGDKWLTPKTPLLAGTTRERYLQEGKILEADIKVQDLENYSKVVLLNAMIDFDIIQNITFKN